MILIDKSANAFYLRRFGQASPGASLPNVLLSGPQSGGGGVLSLMPGDGNHTYMQFYARTATPTVCSGRIGYTGTGTGLEDLRIINETNDGNIVFYTTSGSVNNRWRISSAGHLIPFGDALNNPVYDVGTTNAANRVRGIYANTGDFAGVLTVGGGICVSSTNGYVALGQSGRLTGSYGALQNVETSAEPFAMLWNAVYDWSTNQYKFQNNNSQGAAALLLGNDRQLRLRYKAGPATAGIPFTFDPPVFDINSSGNVTFTGRIATSFATTAGSFSDTRGLDLATSISATSGAFKNSPSVVLSASIWTGSAAATRWIGLQAQGNSAGPMYGLAIASGDTRVAWFDGNGGLSVGPNAPTASPGAGIINAETGFKINNVDAPFVPIGSIIAWHMGSRIKPFQT